MIMIILIYIHLPLPLPLPLFILCLVGRFSSCLVHVFLCRCCLVCVHVELHQLCTVCIADCGCACVCWFFWFACYFEFTDMRSAADNIDFQSSLLSRFDMIFIVRDIRNDKRDQELAKYAISLNVPRCNFASDGDGC